MRRALCVLLLAFTSALARNGSEPLNHYGLVALTDSAVGARLAARFKAEGQPVFLVHDVSVGLKRNDIMRFPDRAVLVDEDVWATLRAEGALARIRSSPVVRVQGLAKASSWTQRAELVGDERQRKSFRLGAEILRVLEENFGGSPQANQLTLVFEQDRLTLLASPAFMDQLRLFPVRRVDPEGRPRIISPPPDTLQFARQPFEYRVWAVDPGDPAGVLSYSLHGRLPPGLKWDPARHTLSGTPENAGRWNLVAVVRNAAGRADTLAFSLNFRVNEPPEALPPARLAAAQGSEWLFAPRPRDPDHPGQALRVVPGTLPRGMIYDARTETFRWVPDASQTGKIHPFSFSVEDPIGGRRSYAYDLRVLREESAVLTEGLRIDLPVDTLLRGRAYAWRMSEVRATWQGREVRLEAVTGSDSTRHGNDSLFLLPRHAGMHRLDFTFAAQGMPMTQSLLIPVREDTPPVFLTRAGAWKVRLGEYPGEYVPVAVDPEGEEVTLEAEFAEDAEVSWDGERLRFHPSRPGVHAVRFVARDEGGTTGEQWVTFEAEREPMAKSWIVESHHQGDYAAFTVMRDFGTGRMGVYSPNFTGLLLPDTRWITSETPFVFVGGNLLGRESAARGQTLWGDVGFSFSNPPYPFFFTGGAYLRLNGEWRFRELPFAWIEAEFRTHIHQALYATSRKRVESLQDSGSPVDPGLVTDEELGRSLDKGFRSDNMLMFSRLEALGALGLGFYAGASLWREDAPMRRDNRQWMGGTLRYRLARDSDVYQASLRVGWSPGNLELEGAGWSWSAALRAAFDSPAR